MRELQNYLDKYKLLVPPEASIKKVVVVVLRDECGFEVEEKDVKLQRGGIMISCHPTIRSELIRYSPRVLNTLQHAHNIRLSFIR